MILRSLRIFAAAALFALPAGSAVIGHSVAADPLSAARIARLPADQRAPWLAYLQRSDAALAADHAALAAERRGLTVLPPLPHPGFSARSIPLNREPDWYSSTEARHIADVIVSFQTPSGGWGKNLDMGGQPRMPGQSYVSDNLNKYPSTDDFDAARDPAWHYVGTLDNDATTTEMHFLAEVQRTLPGAAGEPYRAAFLRGIHYLLAAQYPNGGWPQVWPLDGGYHDAITFNDDAVLHATEVLSGIAADSPDTRFVPSGLRQEAHAAADRALGCILAAQVVLHGQKTIWAQQVDMLSLQPVAARNFEPASLASSESAALLQYLMQLPHPSPAVQSAVRAAVAWLKAHELYGLAVEGGRQTPEGRHTVAQPGAGPLWARYYSLDAEKPIFGDRDKTIHDSMNEISLERRNGYGWYNTEPAAVLDSFQTWTRTFPHP